MNTKISFQTPPPAVHRPQRVRQHASAETAFTRLDLFALLATSVLMAGLVLPLMAGTRPRAEQATCANNLRQIGQAVQSWGAEHGNKPPWQVYAWEGGHSYNRAGSAWDEFYFLKYELRTPKILVCPSDNRRVAAHWNNTPDGGFLNGNFRNNAVSYFIGLHGLPEDGAAILSGDRNLRASSFNNYCSALVNNAASLFRTDPAVQWTNAIHGLSGNLLFSGGAVLQVSNPGLTDALLSQTNTGNSGENQTIHLLLP